MKVAKAGGPPIVLASRLNGPFFAGLDADFYYGNHDPAIAKVTK